MKFTKTVSSAKQFLLLRRHLASEGIVSLGIRLSRCVCVCRISLGGKGNMLHPVLSRGFIDKHFSWIFSIKSGHAVFFKFRV